MTELKPCPFCGNKEVELGGSNHVGREGNPYWYVTCGVCGASVFGDTIKKKAIAAWNRRAEK